MFLLLVCVGSALHAVPNGVKIDFDARNTNIRFLEAKASSGLNVTYAGWLPAETKESYVIYYGSSAAPEKWTQYTISFTPDKSGVVRMMVRGDYSPDKNKYHWVHYDGFEAAGTKLLNPSFEGNNGILSSNWEGGGSHSWYFGAKDAADGAAYGISTHDSFFAQDITVSAGVPVSIKFMARNGGLEDRKTVSDRLFLRQLDEKAQCRVQVDIDARQFNVKLQDIKCSSNASLRFDDSERGAGKSYLLMEGKNPLTSEWEDFEVSFVPSGSTQVFIVLRGFPVDKGRDFWVAYDDIVATGTDNLPNSSFEKGDAGKFNNWSGGQWNIRFDRDDAADGRNYAIATNDRPFKASFAVFGGKRVTIGFKAKGVGSALKLNAPVLVERPRSYYRVYNEKVKYLPLSDKGISPTSITPRAPKVVPSERQYPEFTEAISKVEGVSGRQTASFELLEEDGVERDELIRFGLPLPEKGLYDLNKLRVLDGAGRNVSAQKSAIAWWQDRSVKVALLQFPARLKAHEKAVYRAEFGGDVKDEGIKSRLAYTDDGAKVSVNTGILTAKIDKNSFCLISEVGVLGKTVGSFNKNGIVLVDENGRRYTSAAAKPSRFAVEENGRYRLVFRVDGKLTGEDGAELFDYVARVGFTAESSKVDFTVSIYNTNLNAEFTDVTSLGISFEGMDGFDSLTMDGKTTDRMFQHNDRKLQVGREIAPEGTRMSGAGKTNGAPLSFALRDAWQRYPKAVSVAERSLNFELLPEQPDKKFGSELIYYLSFPFCEGKYRSKWGMGFTEEFSIDFSGKCTPAEIAARRIVPVISRDYLHGTNVFDGIMPEADHTFDKWDAKGVNAFYSHMRAKEARREYGFFNYGDSFGERGRNWTNNEYDLANGLFLLFLRSGNRDVWRWAQIAARHQADVDIVHAYPDRGYIGANAQHGIGHTGVNYQVINPATWSYKYDVSYWGTNGHTWSEGMLASWMYCGDAVTMDAALLLGRHLRDYVAPGFTGLGSHERSAGWSVRAMLAYYRTTGDERYLTAARRVVNIALSEQKFDKGGAWPHVLPGDHSGGYKNAFGNCPYLMGILSEMMREYYRIEPRPEVKRSLISVAGWLKRTYSSAGVGWPYAASWDAKPYHQPGSGCNLLILPGLLSGGYMNGDTEIFDIGKDVVDFSLVTGFGGYNGKQLAMNLCNNAATIEGMKAYIQDKKLGLTYSGNGFGVLKAMLGRETILRMRGPVEKEFQVYLDASEAEISLDRVLHGSRPSGEKEFTVKVIAPDGKEMTAYKGATSVAWKQKVKLNGKSGDCFKVLIHDDYSGAWNIPSGQGFKAFGMIVDNYTFGVGNVSRQYITVPAGVKEFSIRLTPVHDYEYSVFLIDENDSLVQELFGSKSTGFSRLPWLDYAQDPDPTKVMKVQVKPVDKDRCWKIVYLAPWDMGIAFEGIPKAVSTVPAVYPVK